MKNHEEVELLLESYHKVADEIVQVSSNLVSAIRNTEEIVRAILDANRNSLMLLDLKFSIGTLGISGGMFIAALYGMNLKNYMEEHAFGFAGVGGLCTAVTAVAIVWAFRRLRKVQRLSMWGGNGSMNRNRGRDGRVDRRVGRGNWREIDSPVGMAGNRERHEQLRHEHSPEGEHMRGGARGLAETVTGLKQGEKFMGWQSRHAPKDRSHGVVVDGALPPVPVGQ